MKILGVLNDFFTYVCIVVVGFCAWIGAEYLIYEYVSLNYIDGIVGLILAWYIYRSFKVISRKLNHSCKK